MCCDACYICGYSQAAIAGRTSDLNRAIVYEACIHLVCMHLYESYIVVCPFSHFHPFSTALRVNIGLTIISSCFSPIALQDGSAVFQGSLKATP